MWHDHTLSTNYTSAASCFTQVSAKKVARVTTRI